MVDIIEKTIVFVQKELQHNESGHDWFHIERVYNTAVTIAKKEACDLTVVKLAALLHDIADSKFHNGDESVGPEKAADFLESLRVAPEIIEHVKKIIENISFKGGNFEKNFHSKELDVVQDADRLDAIGAIGIARAFNYGGYKNRVIYDPAQQPEMNMTKEEYKNSNGTTINHFYEKLLLLKDRMNTETGIQMAQQRHNYMEGFLNEFFDEWKGNI